MYIKNLLLAVEMLSLLPFCKPVKSRDTILNNIKTKLVDDRSKDLSFDEKSELMLFEVNRSCNKENYYSIRHSLQVKDFEDKEYIFTLFDPCGYSVMNSKTLETVEFVPFADIDIKEYRSDYRYVPTVGLLYEEGDSYKGVFTPFVIKRSDIDFDKKHQRDEINIKKQAIKEKIRLYNIDPSPDLGTDTSSWVINVDTQEVTADVEIDHSWFYKHNTDQFAYAHPVASDYSSWYANNPSAPEDDEAGLCEYIAFLLIMEYHQYFSSDGYFSPTEKNTYVTNPEGYYQEFIDAIPIIDDSWILDLWKANNYALDIGMFAVTGVYNRFMNGRRVQSNCVYAGGSFGNPKDVVDHSRPDMISAFWPDPKNNDASKCHNIVCYGYFNQGQYNGKYLTHYGFKGRYSQCIVSPNVFTVYDWSVKNNNFHYCASEFNVWNDWWCGCESD